MSKLSVSIPCGCGRHGDCHAEKCQCECHTGAVAGEHPSPLPGAEESPAAAPALARDSHGAICGKVYPEEKEKIVEEKPVTPESAEFTPPDPKPIEARIVATQARIEGIKKLRRALRRLDDIGCEAGNAVADLMKPIPSIPTLTDELTEAQGSLSRLRSLRKAALKFQEKP
jgi:hypothetical protein